MTESHRSSIWLTGLEGPPAPGSAAARPRSCRSNSLLRLRHLGVIGIVCLIVALAASLTAHSRQARKARKRQEASEQAAVRAQARSASPDEVAPDFTLPEVRDGRSVRLSDLREHKPVVLIFGSFG